MVIFVCSLDDLILGFCYRNSKQETGGLELASTMTHVPQTNRLTKCGSHIKVKCTQISYKKCFIYSVNGRVSGDRYRKVNSRGECELEPKNDVR